MLKNNIRKSLLEQGLLLSDKFFLEADLIIQRAVIEKINIEASKNNLLYFPFRKEAKLDLLIKEINNHQNNIYIPRIFENKKMKFNLLQENSILKKNKFGINEIMSEDFIDPFLFDTMFIPLVGVDINGCRLGYGGGFFDRALSKMNTSKIKPLIVGLCYDFQIIDEEFGEPHDVKYDLVITETNILSYS